MIKDSDTRTPSGLGPSARLERGPSARRGLQFAQDDMHELLLAFAKAKATLRVLKGLDRPSLASSVEVQELQRLDHLEREKLRRQTADLLTDLRAELRRRTQL